MHIVFGSKKIVSKNLTPLEYGNPVQYSCLKNPMDRTVHGVPRVGQDLLTKPWSCTQTVTLSANKISFISFVLSYLIKIFLGGLCWIFIAALRLSLIVVSALLISMTSLVAEQGFSSCSSWTHECGLSSCGCTGLVAPRHVETSRTKD